MAFSCKSQPQKTALHKPACEVTQGCHLDRTQRRKKTETLNYFPVTRRWKITDIFCEVTGSSKLLKTHFKRRFLEDETGWAQLLITTYNLAGLVSKFSPCITLLRVFTSTDPLLYFCLLNHLVLLWGCRADHRRISTLISGGERESTYIHLFSMSSIWLCVISFIQDIFELFSIFLSMFTRSWVFTDDPELLFTLLNHASPFFPCSICTFSTALQVIGRYRILAYVV